jgi:hypothetical protein
VTPPAVKVSKHLSGHRCTVCTTQACKLQESTCFASQRSKGTGISLPVMHGQVIGPNQRYRVDSDARLLGHTRLFFLLKTPSTCRVLVIAMTSISNDTPQPFSNLEALHYLSHLLYGSQSRFSALGPLSRVENKSGRLHEFRNSTSHS